MRKETDAFYYTPLFTMPTMRLDQSTENCSTATRIRVGYGMFCSSKIHNIGYILLKQTPLKTHETLKKNVCRSLQTI